LEFIAQYGGWHFQINSLSVTAPPHVFWIRTSYISMLITQ